MKKLLIILLAFFFFTTSFAPATFHCPVTGRTKNNKLPAKSIVALNRLKNRSTDPQTMDHSITLSKILAPGNDIGRFDSTRGATITGFITNVVSGKGEDCNCYYGKDPYVDTHIEIAATEGETDKKKVMVIEITPRFKAHHPEWRTTKLNDFIGKKVTVTGWMMFDNRHWQNSLNTNPNGGDLYRATAWEIHPVTAFEVQQ